MTFEQWEKAQGGNPITIDGSIFYPSGARRTLDFMGRGSQCQPPPSNTHVRLRRQEAYWQERARRIDLDGSQLRAALEGRSGFYFSWDNRCIQAYGVVQRDDPQGAVALLARLSNEAHEQLGKVRQEYRALTRPQPIPLTKDYATSNGDACGRSPNDACGRSPNGVMGSQSNELRESQSLDPREAYQQADTMSQPAKGSAEISYDL
jgi:hypothetical protein